MMCASRLSRIRGLIIVAMSMALLTSGCQWQGLNSLPMPGAVGRGAGSTTIHVEMADVGSLESNSPVMIDDVVVGSVGRMVVRKWHADIEVSVRPGVVIPANAVATVGQTSLLGSSHLQLNSPLGVAPQGRLSSGATIPLNKSSTYPSTEQTLSSLSVVLNSGGMGQIDEIIKQFSAAIGGRGNEIRDLLSRLEHFVGTLDDQARNIVTAMDELNMLAEKVNAESEVVEQTLRKLPRALNVLVAERSNLTTALDRLRVFSDTSTGLVRDVKADLIADLQNLEPTIGALADAGTDIGKGLQEATVFPFAQWVVDDAIKGDYANLYTTMDLTTTRLRTDLLAGTRWGRFTQPVPDLLMGNPPPPVPYTDNPLGVGTATPPPPVGSPGGSG
ncbi:MCE family protein [Mycolicibacter heraklionensis]|uniref:MCE family protein n=1 Tax=Mycolicibacter heraklionensis TaxID=512402 RepID=UPI0009E22F49|nr:MCE family protein [Mycolicibacter heraklionensis]